MDCQDDENVDIAEIEANLYAKIHHDAPETVEQYTSAALLHQQLQASRVVTKQTVVNKTGTQATNSQNGRYWGDGKHQARAKVSSNKGRLNPFSVANQQGLKTNASPPQPIVPADYRPKPFTPYTSLFGSVVNEVSSSKSIPTGESVTHPVPKTPQSKKRRKNMLNPFNRLNEDKLKRKEKLTVKKERATTAKINKCSKPIDTINLDTSEEDEDDDVICIPVTPPPLVCIESSEDEADNVEPDLKQQTNFDDNAIIPEDFIGQRDRSRMSQIIEDDAFGGIGDDELSYICDTVESAVRCHESEILDAANDNTPNEITENCSSLPVNSSTELEGPSTVCEDDSVVFATPQKTAVASSKPTYEVSEHGFAAVDVYESESSDFPESVYGKGSAQATTQVRPINASDSECSDIQINTHNRSKRMMKRKSSTSNKGSDYKTDDGDESDDGVPFLEIFKDTSTPYLQRGEAVNNAKLDKRNQKLVTRRKSVGEKPAPSQHSDDEFLSMLSCIVHDNPDKDSNLTSTEDDPSSSKTNEESSSIDARQVVEHVLRKMSKSALPQDTAAENWVVTDEVVTSDVEDEISAMAKESNLPVEAEEVIKEGKSLNWIVKDQIGETDNFVENVIPTTIIVEPLASAADIVQTTTNNNDVSKNIAGPIEPNTSNQTDNQCVRSCSLAVDPEIGWNDEMKHFYNDSWGGESFSISAIQNDMPYRRAYEWSVLPDDNYVQRRNNQNRNLRCINCREEGHRMQDCYMPPKQAKCHMCGQTGHREPRCPKTICLRCGNQNRVFSRGCNRCHYMQGLVCPLCKTRGHGIRECPDKWRRYHSTIESGQPLKKLPKLLNKIRYCCICTGKGHSAEYCRNALRVLDTPMPPTHIHSYNDVYDPIKQENSGDKLEESARFALMSAPVENLQFSWDVDESPNRFYGRIMSATNIIRQPIIEPKKKRRIKNCVQMVINPMNTINRDQSKRKKEFVKNFYEDKTSQPNIYTHNAPDATHVVAVQDPEVDCNIKELNGAKVQQPNKQERFAENFEQNNINVKKRITYSKPVEADAPVSVTNPSVDVSPVPIVTKKRSETTIRNPDKQHVEIHHEENENDQQNNPEQLNKSLENGDQINFSFTKTLNECRDQKFNLNNIFGKYSANVSEPLLNASNDWINSNFPNVSKHILNARNGEADQLTMEITPNNVRDIGEASTPFIQRNSTPYKEQRAKNATTKEKLVRSNVECISVPQAPSPPSMFRESDKMAAEVRRLEQSQKFLENLKHTLSTPISYNESGDFVVSLNEDVEEATRQAKRIRFDSDSNYSFSEFFVDFQSDELNDSAKESTSVDDTGSNPDYIPLDNGNNEEDVEEVGDIMTEIGHMDVKDPPQTTPVEKSIIFLTKDQCKYLLTSSGNAFLRNANSEFNVVVHMEWRSTGNILTVEGPSRSQQNFHNVLHEYWLAAEKAAHVKKLTSRKLPRNRLSLIRFIKEQICQLENSHGNVKELYLRMCVLQKQSNKNNIRNSDRIRRSLNMILMGQTGLREGPLHLRLLQSNLKSLLLMNEKEVTNPMREEVFKHYQYIFSPFEHSDYPGLLSEYEAIRKQKQRPDMKLDRSLLGLQIDITFPATAEAASPRHDTTSECDEKNPLFLTNEMVERHNTRAPPVLLEAVKRMKKNNWIKSEAD